MSNFIRVENKRANFTILHNGPLNDTEISWKAKGLLVYLLSRPNNWRINPEQLRKASLGGRDAVYSILKELIIAGYIVRRQLRSNGKANGYEYIVLEDKSCSDSSFTERLFTEKPFTEKPYINKNLPEIRTDSNKDLFSGEPQKQKKSIEEIIREQKIDFCKRVIEFVKKNLGKYPKRMYVEFCKYWLEPSITGKKLRFQDEKFFEVGRRLSTWFQNDSCQKQLKEYWEAEEKLPGLNKLLNSLL